MQKVRAGYLTAPDRSTIFKLSATTLYGATPMQIVTFSCLPALWARFKAVVGHGNASRALREAMEEYLDRLEQKGAA